jgi:hypothetical protein
VVMLVWTVVIAVPVANVVPAAVKVAATEPFTALAAPGPSADMTSLANISDSFGQNFPLRRG